MRSFYKTVLYLSLIKLAVLQTFNVSLADSLQLRQNHAGIVNVATDFSGNFLISFSDGQIRKYSPDFSSYQILPLKEIVEDFKKKYQFLSQELENGDILQLSGQAISLISNKSKTLRYVTRNFDSLEYFTFNDTIIKQYGLTIDLNNILRIAHLICFRHYFIITYNGLSSYYNIGQVFPNKTQLTTIINWRMQNLDENYFGRFLIKSYYFACFGNQIYQMTVTLDFVYNETIEHFDLNQSIFAQQKIYSAPTQITNLLRYGDLLLMLSNNSGNAYLFEAYLRTNIQIQNIPLEETFNFFYIYNSYYFLQSKGLIKLDFDGLASTLSYNSLITTLPYNTYMIVLNGFNVFYIPNQPYIYKAGMCLGQSSMVNLSCVEYNCSVGNCSFCPFSPLVCSICIDGFSLNGNYSCQLSDIKATQSAISALLAYFKSLLMLLISVPGARRAASPLFYYFGVFDDLCFYQFHDRVYSPTMNEFFSNLNDVQSKKWSLINDETVLGWMKVDKEAFQNATDYKSTYDTYRFTDIDHSDVGPEGLWGNCRIFFLVALPITIIAFLFGRIMFRILFNFVVSKVFRRFDFWPLLLLLLFDGNIQQFAFYQATDWKNMFFFGFGSKWVKVQTVVFGFVLVVVSTALYLISYGFYHRLNRHLMDNNRNVVRGHFSLIVQFGLRNCLLGVMHSFLRALQYQQMLTVLLVAQVGFMVFFTVSIGMKVYVDSLKIWIYVLLNFVKAVIILSFVIRSNEPIVEVVQQTLFFLLIALFVVGCLLQTIFFVKQIGQALISIFCFKANKREVNAPTFQRQLKMKNVSRFRPKSKSQLVVKSQANVKQLIQVQVLKENIGIS